MLSQKKLAIKLGVSAATISRWVKGKKIPYFLLNGIVRFDEAVINNWIKGKEVKVRQML